VAALRCLGPLGVSASDALHRRFEALAGLASCQERAKRHLGHLRVVGVGRETPGPVAPPEDVSRHSFRAVGFPDRLEAPDELDRVPEGVPDGRPEDAAGDTIEIRRLHAHSSITAEL